VLCIAGVLVSGGQSAALAGGTPYTDNQVRGYITFYDKSGAAVTTGDVATRPFVWRAVGSEAAPEPYNGDGRKAALLAFVPRENVNVEDWSGDLLVQSTDYTDAAHPKAQATNEDFSLADFFDNLPPRWEGYVQIRMFYAMPDAPAVTKGYAATNIQVTGTTWTVVGGGPAVEEASPPAPQSSAGSVGVPGGATAGPGDAASPTPSASATGGAGGSSGGSPAAGASGADPQAVPVSAQSQRSGSRGGVWLVTAVVVALMSGGGLVVVAVARRRRSADG
jgi:hypothetical protein